MSLRTLRHIITLAIGLLGAPLAADAQQAKKVFQIGYLGNSTPSLESALVEGFRQGLRENGYFEGQNIVLHYRWAEGRIEPLPRLAAELVRLKVDVIVTSGTPAGLAAKRATTTIPIVLASTGDPIGAGLVSSLARPGGNITGLSPLYPELEGKRLQLLKEIVPRLNRAAFLAGAAPKYQCPSFRPNSGSISIALRHSAVASSRCPWKLRVHPKNVWASAVGYTSMERW